MNRIKSKQNTPQLNGLQRMIALLWPRRLEVGRSVIQDLTSKGCSYRW